MRAPNRLQRSVEGLSAEAFPLNAIIRLNATKRDRTKDKSIKIRRALVNNTTVRNAIGMVIPRRTGNTTVQSTYTMTGLQYDVNSTMLDVVLPTVAPVTQRVVSDRTAPPPLPEPTEAVFKTDGHSCTDSVWFDKDVIREITHRADIDPTFALGPNTP